MKTFYIMYNIQFEDGHFIEVFLSENVNGSAFYFLLKKLSKSWRQ